MRSKYLPSAVIIVLFFSFLSCKEEIEEPVTDENADIVDSEDKETKIEFPLLIDSLQASIDLENTDSIDIKLTEQFKGFGERYPYQVGEDYYIAELHNVIIEGLSLDYSVFGSNTLKIWSKSLFPTNNSIKLKFTVLWTLEGEILDRKKYEFDVLASGEAFPLYNISSSYPLDRQYFFLKDEFPHGFFVLNRRPLEVPDLVANVYTASGDLIGESAVTLDDSISRLNFDIPDLENESIYSIDSIKENEVIYTIDFRTSRYDSFSQKVSDITFDSRAMAPVALQWRHEYLQNWAEIKEEGFDSAEVNLGYVKFEENQSPYREYDFPYLNGLIRVHYIPSDSEWYNLMFNRIYAPFPSYLFTPRYPEHNQLNIDNLPLKATEIYVSGNQEGLASLSNEEIRSGISNPANTETRFLVANYFQSVAVWDHDYIREQILDKFGDEEIGNERMNYIRDNKSIPLHSYGKYKHQFVYTLPDGTETSKVDFTMNYLRPPIGG